jgi:hypothetical protein
MTLQDFLKENNIKNSDNLISKIWKSDLEIISESKLSLEINNPNLWRVSLLPHFINSKGGL